MKVKHCVIFLLFLFFAIPFLFGDDFIHLKNGRVIGVTKYSIKDGWIHMELPGGGEIGTSEDQVEKIEKANIQLVDYKPREAVEYKADPRSRRSKPPRGPDENMRGQDVFADDNQQAMDREERRRQAKERMERFREMQSRGQPLDDKAREDLMRLEEEMRGERRGGTGGGGKKREEGEPKD